MSRGRKGWSAAHAQVFRNEATNVNVEPVADDRHAQSHPLTARAGEPAARTGYRKLNTLIACGARRHHRNRLWISSGVATDHLAGPSLDNNIHPIAPIRGAPPPQHMAQLGLFCEYRLTQAITTYQLF